MLKKITVFIILMNLFLSCFHVKQARKIDVNEIDAPDNDANLSFTFEFDGNMERFEKKSLEYFKLKETYFPYSFSTTTLFPNDTLSVFVYPFEDNEKMLQLVTISDFLGTRDQKEEPTVKKTLHHYISIQVTDQEGNDVLKEESFRNKAVMEKLRFYQRIVD